MLAQWAGIKRTEAAAEITYQLRIGDDATARSQMDDEDGPASALESADKPGGYRISQRRLAVQR